MFNKKKTGFGIVVTDWKTNKKKNMESNDYTKPMREPFKYLPNNALGHYNTQLPLYGKLLLKMLKQFKSKIFVHYFLNTSFLIFLTPKILHILSYLLFAILN